MKPRDASPGGAAGGRAPRSPLASPRVRARGARSAVRRWVRPAVSGGAVLASVLGAVAWQGFDARELPPDNASVWAMQTVEGRRIARVNTELGEFDTIKSVSNPSGIAQFQDSVMVFTESNSRVATIDATAPIDLAAAQTDLFTPTPAGTRFVVNSGNYVAYLTVAGDVFATTISGQPSRPTVAIAPPEVEGEVSAYRADAVGVDETGAVFSVWTAGGVVRVGDARTGEVASEESLSGVPDGARLAITGVAGSWVVLNELNGDVWLPGVDGPTPTGATGPATLMRAAATGTEVYVADTFGLIRVSLDGLEVDRIVGDGTALLGQPARPASLGGVTYAAWLREGAGGGTLWSSTGGESTLSYEGQELPGDSTPSFRTNGVRMILNEARSGWVWDVATGGLMPMSLDWAATGNATTESDQTDIAQVVTDPRPPVAEPDAFGARAGRLVTLPVLLNDHDPNEDVLSIIPGSVDGLDPAFGTVVTVNNDQQLVVDVAAEAEGTAVFSYAVTDGSTATGINSARVNVSVTVKPDSINTAPVWCGVEGCLQTWPTPSVVPGGTVTVDALRGWVDPEGDPIFIAGATATAGIVTATPDGLVVFQHLDPASDETITLPVAITVSDSRGATASKTLAVQVSRSAQLAASSFAVVTTAGVRTTVPVAAYVNGTSASTRLTEAKLPADSDATITLNPATLSFGFSAPNPGIYLVSYTVNDGAAEVSATVRVTVLDPAAERMSASPITAFVRAKEDVTVDVMPAVSNPAGRVLLVGAVTAKPRDGAALSVDVVGQSLIRIGGSFASGEVGELGVVRYTVSDGTGISGHDAVGEITVVLLPASDGALPIAVDDTVTVRVGTQVDIPVLDNDVAPTGGVVALDAASVSAPEGAGLAFASGRELRYVAPDVPGVYVVTYRAFTVGFPTLADTASVTITVTNDDSNAPPTPPDLVGRVISGQSVTVPFSPVGIDPDGDAVTLAQIVRQPEHGSAAIAPTGDGLIYSSDPSFTGQDSFTYRVRDARGLTGDATVRIGVLDQQLTPGPVTFSDYVQAQGNAISRVVVAPLGNDLDMGGGELDLIEVRPDASFGSDEYDALAGQFTELRDDLAIFTMTGELGTFSYQYTARNSAGDTAIGLIVIRVVREAVSDYPVVEDTILTVDTREQFATGVDVVSGRVSWSGGDVAGLTLSLWHPPAGVVSRGLTIRGELTDEPMVIPFRLAGKDFRGADVVTYGFLRIPGAADVRLSLRASAAAVRVNEGESVTFDIADLVTTPPGDELEVNAAAVRAGGSRAAATCTRVDGTRIRYNAGEDAPWTDTCTVPVKVDGQEDFTVIVVPIEVVPDIPQPTVRAAAISVAPGTSSTYDLSNMVEWPAGAEPGEVAIEYTYAGQLFRVTRTGNLLAVGAIDSAPPFTTEPITVRLASHPEVPAATLTLTVGPAPVDLPKGATVSKQCSQATGLTCTITVIGGPGEVNPLPRTALTLVSVTNPSTCPGVTFAVGSAGSIVATWQADTAGALCQGRFAVEDAQGRISSDERLGTVTLDLQGLPAAPASLTQVAFGPDSATLRVDPGPSARAYPAVTEYRLYQDGAQVATCDTSGICPTLSGLANGTPVTFTARAINAVGESRAAVTTQAWAYRAPDAPSSVSAVPSKTGGDGLYIDLEIAGIDSTTASFTIKSDSGETREVAVAGSSLSVPGFFIGANATTPVVVTARTRLPLPPVSSASEAGGSVTIVASGAGRPLGLSATVTVLPGARDLQVDATAQRNGDGTVVLFGIALGTDVCTAVTPGSNAALSAFSQSVRVPRFTEVTVTVCAETVVAGDPGYGTAASTHTTFTWEDPGPPVGDRLYDVSPTAYCFLGECQFGLTWPTFTAEPGFTWEYVIDGVPTGTNADPTVIPGQPLPVIEVRQCTTAGGTEQCSDPPAPIQPTALDRQYSPRYAEPMCTTGVAPTMDATFAPGDALVEVLMFRQGGILDDPYDPALITDLPDEMVRASFAITWAGRLAGLDPASFRVDCLPAPLPGP